MDRIQIAGAERAHRMLDRLAHEVLERNRGADTLEIVGIRRRGLALAHALAERIERLEGAAPAVHELDVTPYRDDRPADARADDTSRFLGDITDRDVILVDDVLFTGRTARAALDAVVQFGRPRTIQLMVLVDRGHREYPIQPDYVGRVVPTKYRERVEVDVSEDLGVYIVETN